GFVSTALLSILSNQDTTINGEGGLNLTISNNGTQIAGPASVSVFTGGNLTASSINLLLNNRDGGLINDSASIFFDIGLALNTTGDAFLILSSRNDGGGNGTTIGSANISLNADSVSIGGDLVLGTTPGNAFAAFNTTGVIGDLVTQGGADFSIQNGGTTLIGLTSGGSIETDAIVTVVAGNIFSGDFLNSLLTNINGGQIGDNAAIAFQVTGDISVETDALWQLINSTLSGELIAQIGSDASISIVANNLTAGSLFASLSNVGGGIIGNDATVSFFATNAISSAGDATFRILNFDDGSDYGGGTIGGDATVSIDAQSLSAATLIVRINNLGGTIGGDATVDVNLGAALTTTGNATFDILNDPTLDGGSVGGSSSVSVNAGSLAIGGSLIARITDLTTPVDFDNVNIGATDDISVGDQILVDGNVTAGGNISATNGMILTGGSLIAGGDITATAGAITMNVSSDGQIGLISAGGDIFAAGAINAFYFDTSITAGGSITAFDLGAVTISAGSDITVGEAAGSAHSIFTNTITAGGALSLINVGNIQSITLTSAGGIGFTPDPFTLSVDSISAVGPAIADLIFNGLVADPNFEIGNPGNGGLVTLNLAADGLTIGSSGDIASIQASGGDFDTNSVAGGNGGTVDITATGDITLLDGDITATSGAVPDFATILGDGGTVNITTPGAITVSSKIEVSSKDVEASPVRRSAKGGNINLTSTKATAGAAITVSNTGQLLALLDQAAPGPGGKITILASGGGGSSVNVNGSAQADRGTIDIRHTGANGTVNLSDASGSNFVFLHGDVVKAGALGANGVLTVGQGFISADNVLKLYGASADGEVRFVDNVSIGGQNFTIIAANTVTILDNKVVTINGARADVYTGFNGQGIPNANYTGSGGNGSTTGAFGGAGANNPVDIGQAPLFDGPPGG
nr:hypothetical protein [Chthoniobacterales bacterium]